jgi:molybdopterin-guanine dinucleotide biosynthesis protein B
VHRAANGKPLLFPDDAYVVGIACDVPVETTLPVAHLDSIEDVAALMLRFAVPIDDVLARASEP